MRLASRCSQIKGTRKAGIKLQFQTQCDAVSHSLLSRLCAVRDFSRASVSIEPAEFGSWAEARSALLTEAKRPTKAAAEAEIAAADGDEERIDKIRAGFSSKERAIEHEIDHRPLEVHMSLGVSCECFQDLNTLLNYFSATTDTALPTTQTIS